MRPLACLTTTLAAFLALTSATADVPLETGPAGHAMAPVTVDGKGQFSFVVDTGAQGTVVYNAFAKATGLEVIPGKTEVAIGQTGEMELPFVRLPSLTVDGRTLAPIETVVLPDRKDGIALDGILGVDLMGGYVVDLNLRDGRFALLPPETDPARLLGDGAFSVAVRRDPETGLIFLPVSINGAAGTAVLDSGNRRTLVNWRFATAAGIREDSPELVSDGVLHGLSNTTTETKRGKLGTLGLAGTEFPDFSARIADLPIFGKFALADRPAMILGLDTLKDLRVVVDYPRARLWFHKGQ